jgi:Hpt domain.
MEERLLKLKNLGCDIDGAMNRFLGDKEFYFECFDELMKDPGFEELKTALEKHDIDMAFENAHTLKGVLSNLGLAPLSEQMGQIVETLRFGSEEGLLKKYQELEIQIEGFKSV